ncbi:hypothetical protein ALC57_17628 [Trachymyrmex cornetzi]|uniref:Uncharacterized protein n=1 Tax=Trachymyrmex cornetzi TaxID=471704 RepID=A0A151ITB3_9HYME|nr:hypothetical protein ALC57_17628 [Trachymyrmex cornetzi]
MVILGWRSGVTANIARTLRYRVATRLQNVAVAVAVDGVDVVVVLVAASQLYNQREQSAREASRGEGGEKDEREKESVAELRQERSG